MGLGTYRLRMSLLRRAAPRSGRIARFLRFPDPFTAPWRRSVLDIGRDVGLGDVLMCTPALRELKRRHPDSHVRFYTDFAPLVRGLPYIDEVLPWSVRPKDTILLRYEEVIPPRAHIARILGDQLGVNVRDVCPDCVIQDNLVAGFQHAWRDWPRPYITVNRRAGDWTPNKDWPDQRWSQLICALARSATVIEIGKPDPCAGPIAAGHYIDLRGRTLVEELAAAIAAADFHLGPISGPVHIAAAARRPSIIIAGGYEHPSSAVAYSGNVVFYTDVDCAPCWLRSPCPYDRKCLTAITPAAVADSLWQAWASIKAGSSVADIPATRAGGVKARIIVPTALS
jgi:ADP-heptose:LPS heptosyltransferase